MYLNSKMNEMKSFGHAVRWVAIAVIFCAGEIGFAVPPKSADDGPRDFTITAGNAFFDQTPTLGEVCTFDFGDPAGAYNVLTGYNAAHIYDKAGTYKLTLTRAGQPPAVKTIHVQPDHRGVQLLDARSGLVDVIRSLQNDTIILLPPGSSWDLPGPLDIKARNVEFRPSGPGPAPRIRRLASKGFSSLLCTGLDITFKGIEFDSDRDMKIVGNKKIGLRAIVPDGAHIVAIDCKFRNFDDAIFCTPMTRGLLVQWCTFTDEIRGYGMWVDGCNLAFLGNKMATSQREHNIRSNGLNFYNLLVYDNDMTATHGKETLTFRVGQDLYAAHNAFHGWVRVGPADRGDVKALPSAVQARYHATHAVIERNAFLGGAILQINEHTSDLTVRYNRIDVDAQSVPVHIQGPGCNGLVIENNYRVLTAGPTQKPYVRAMESSPGDYLERNNLTLTPEEAQSLKGK
jgi:hypothetical protein